MKKLLRHRDIVREAVTRGVAVISSLLRDSLRSTGQIRSHLRTVNSQYEESKSLDKRVHETNDLDELQADLFESYEHDEKVAEIRTQVYFARASAVPSLVAAQSTGAPSHYYALNRKCRPRRPTVTEG